MYSYYTAFPSFADKCVFWFLNSKPPKLELMHIRSPYIQGSTTWSPPHQATGGRSSAIPTPWRPCSWKQAHKPGEQPRINGAYIKCLRSTSRAAVTLDWQISAGPIPVDRPRLGRADCQLKMNTKRNYSTGECHSCVSACWCCIRNFQTESRWFDKCHSCGSACWCCIRNSQTESRWFDMHTQIIRVPKSDFNLRGLFL